MPPDWREGLRVDGHGPGLTQGRQAPDQIIPVPVVPEDGPARDAPGTSGGGGCRAHRGRARRAWDPWGDKLTHQTTAPNRTRKSPLRS